MPSPPIQSPSPGPPPDAGTDGSERRRPLGRSFGTKKVPDEEGSSKGSKGRCRKRMEKEGKMASVVSHSLLLQKEMKNRKVMCGVCEGWCVFGGVFTVGRWLSF